MIGDSDRARVDRTYFLRIETVDARVMTCMASKETLSLAHSLPHSPFTSLYTFRHSERSCCAAGDEVETAFSVDVKSCDTGLQPSAEPQYSILMLQ